MDSWASMFWANASTRPGWTGQRSITLQVMEPEGSLPSNRVRHFHSSFSELPVVEHEYWGYCVNATARPPFPPPKPSLSSWAYISSVNGLAYRKAT